MTDILPDNRPETNIEPVRDDAGTSLVFKFTLPSQAKKGPELMKATVWHKPGHVRTEMVPKPHLTDPGDAIIRVTTTAVCGSDLHLYLGKAPSVRPLERGYLLGHEAVGFVDEIGPDVRNMSLGDRVVISAVIACGQCAFCLKQAYSCCDVTDPSRQMEKVADRPKSSLFSFSHLTGSFDGCQAEFVRVPCADVNLLKLPASISDDVGVLLADVACTGWHANEMAKVKPGDTVCVWGCGEMGLMAQKWARFRGARFIVAIDNETYSLGLARQLAGVDEVINFDYEEVIERIFQLIPGGPDVVIDAAGYRFPNSIKYRLFSMLKGETEALDIITEMTTVVKKTGRMALIGEYFGSGNQFPIGAFMEKSLHCRGGQVSVQKYWNLLLSYIVSGQIDLSGFITHRLPFEQIPEAYKMMNKHAYGVLKITVKLPLPQTIAPQPNANAP